MLKMLKVSNETVEATGEGWGELSTEKRKSTVLGSTGKGSHFQTQGAGIVICSRLYLAHRFSLSRRAFVAVPG